MTATILIYLGKVGGLAGLVLSHLVQSVLLALLPLAKCLSLLRNVDHFSSVKKSRQIETNVKHNQSGFVVASGFVGDTDRQNLDMKENSQKT